MGTTDRHRLAKITPNRPEIPQTAPSDPPPPENGFRPCLSGLQGSGFAPADRLIAAAERFITARPECTDECPATDGAETRSRGD